MRPQRIVAWQRLGVGDVEHGFGQTSGVQCLQQVRRDELCAPSDVHETGPARQLREQGCIQDAPRGIGQRQQADQHVAASEQRFELIVAGVAAYAGNIVSGAAPSRTIEIEGDELREHRLREGAQSEDADTAFARGSNR